MCLMMSLVVIFSEERAPSWEWKASMLTSMLFQRSPIIMVGDPRYNGGVLQEFGIGSLVE